ncbi:hypothetical protein PEDI_35370 [Persicobacter diffluens]|uniref:Uncharacterized protein n=1 Tax=Persicobacter diffluens TaxID=981 RepID=A0AAN4W1V9_9BACT|nr:hypothetical protein PEDI_35370 [Persicobacter diffluens]
MEVFFQRVLVVSLRPIFLSENPALVACCGKMKKFFLFHVFIIGQMNEAKSKPTPIGLSENQRNQSQCAGRKPLEGTLILW